MQPFDHPRHLKSRVPPATRLWWDSARVCLYYVNDNDNDGARFYSKSNASNSIELCCSSVYINVDRVKGELLCKTYLQEFQVTDRAGMLDDAFNLARYM